MKKYLAFMLTFLLVFCTACTDNAKKISQQEQEKTTEVVTKKTPDENLTPINGGALKLSMRMPKTLNPLLNNDVTVANCLDFIFQPLFTMDENQKPMPLIAETYVFSEDGLTLLINLHKDILWQDGTRLTARDVDFSIQTIKNTANSLYHKSVENIEKCTVIDDYTLSIKYKTPYACALYLLNFPIIPYSYYNRETNLSSQKNMTPMGSGFYKFDNYVDIKEINLVANENCFKGKPYINNVKIIITPDIETDLYCFNQGKTNIIQADIDEWVKYRSNNVVTINEFVSMNYDFVGFNFDKDIFKNKNIRRAVAYLLPLDEIISEYYLGHAVKTLSPINPESWLYEKNLKGYGYDKQMAKKLFELSGFFESENKGIKILVNKENDERLKVAQRINDELTSIGVKCALDVVDFEEYLKKLESKDYDIFLGGNKLPVAPDLRHIFTPTNVQIKDNKPVGTTFNFYYADEYFANLVNSSLSATNETDMKTYYSTLQKYISEELPYVSIAFRKTALVSDVSVKGDIKPHVSDMYWNINKWFISSTN